MSKGRDKNIYGNDVPLDYTPMAKLCSSVTIYYNGNKHPTDREEVKIIMSTIRYTAKLGIRMI